MALNERLTAIANMIEKGETMADIGTDHGFLPIYLVKAGVCPKVIMTDISPMSLKKAEENAESAGLLCSESVDARVGDGLKVIKDGEVDAVVMAGIGGNLMEEIMSVDSAKTESFKKFILQPRRHPGRLRHYLWREGYSIENEVFVRESKFIWEIILAVPGKNGSDKSLFEMEGVIDIMAGEDPDSIVWEVPPYIKYLKDDLTSEFVRRKLEREKMIASSKKAGKENDTGINEKNIEYLNELLRGMIRDEV